MKAVIQNTYGGPEVLQVMDIPKPVINDKEILIKVHAINVSIGDVRVRGLIAPFGVKFIMRLLFGLKGPRNKVPGFTCSGVIEELGSTVTEYKVGDEVYLINGMRGGCYAEYVKVPAKAVMVPKPSNISFEEVCPIPFGAMTALHFFQKVTVTEGMEILIYGSSGAVGSYALQLAKYYGGEVTSVCSEKNFEMVKSLGADHVIDYKTQDFTKQTRKYDLIFDCVGKITKKKSKVVLKKTGTYLSVKSPTSETKEKLLILNKIICENKLKTFIDKTYRLEEIVEAHRYVEDGHKRGNVVISLKK